ncbi:type ISP restriction/modification enzyme, partial [Lysinibacillus sp. GbtcB16]
ASNLSDNISIFSNISVEGKKVFDMIEDDVPYYIYAVLNSIDYRNIFNHNLSKETPRIPLLKNKEKYVEIGRKLADLHLNYE